MTNLSSALRRRWLVLPVSLLILILAAAVPLTVMAASSGGVGIKINAKNISTSDDDDGSVGDRLKLRVSDPAGTDFSTLVGKAKYKPAAGPVEVFNIDGSTTIDTGALGQIRLTDSTRPGDHIDIGLEGTLEVRVVFSGAPPTAIRFSSGLDQLKLKIKIR